MFDWEHRITLHPMQGNWASSRGEGEVSSVFLSCGRNLAYILFFFFFFFVHFASFINKFHLNISHGEKINVKKKIGIQFTNISIY